MPRSLHCSFLALFFLKSVQSAADDTQLALLFLAIIYFFQMAADDAQGLFQVHFFAAIPSPACFPRNLDKHDMGSSLNGREDPSGRAFWNRVCLVIERIILVIDKIIVATHFTSFHLVSFSVFSVPPLILALGPGKQHLCSVLVFLAYFHIVSDTLLQFSVVVT